MPCYWRPSQHQEEKWWLPVLRVPPDGLPDTARKRLQHHRECTNQILKAAMAINNQVLSKMEVPNCYLETLPKNGKASLGAGYHLSLHNSRPIFARLSSGLQKLHSKHTNNGKDNRSNSKTSWGKMKDFVGDVERRELLSDYK